MKKILPPIVLFLCVFALLQCSIPYTLLSWEENGLFLHTPDWRQQVMSGSWPVLTYVSSWIVQFFHYPLAGAALIALGVALIFLLLWMLLRKVRKVTGFVFAALLVAGVWILGTNKEIRGNERWAKLEYMAQRQKWDKVLSIATPERAKEDRRLLPYALLALSEKGELGNRMFSYPIEGVGDFVFSDWHSRESGFFNSLFYESLGSLNEAVHQTFQSATYLPHGASFGMLRRLVLLSRKQGNDVLADKYATILNQSTLHHYSIDVRAKSSREGSSESLGAAKSLSAKASVVTHDVFFNVGQLLAEGHFTQANVDRFLCMALANRDLKLFYRALLLYADIKRPLPTYYQEALLLLSSFDNSVDISECAIDESVKYAFETERTRDTFFGYYFAVPKQVAGTDV
ncbi:MAG: hypothetical protein J5698_05310 [Bacteroidaceae bacterium]|nr:hypothetical protein [Bacteroidaceae bacterium]